MRFWANESVDYSATIGSSAAHGFPKRVDSKRIEAASSISDIGQCREPSEVLHGSRRFLSAFATIPAGCSRLPHGKRARGIADESGTATHYRRYG